MNEELLARVFAEAEAAMGTLQPDEFTAQMMAENDPENRTLRRWYEVLKNMEHDGKVTSRKARRTGDNHAVRAFKFVEEE